MSRFEEMKATVAEMLQGIERYNPDNLSTLEEYIAVQAKENAYDLEANLSVLRLYQFTPSLYQSHVVVKILLKSLTNLPHTDFVLCKCLMTQEKLEEQAIKHIMYMAELLETCKFSLFWKELSQCRDLIEGVTGFEDAIRKFISHVVNATYQHIELPVLRDLLGIVNDAALKQWIVRNGWKDLGDGRVFIGNQEDLVKTKNITEKIEFDSVAGIMAHCI
nr:EOG090X0BWZ [Triops cancriformis]